MLRSLVMAAGAALLAGGILCLRYGVVPPGLMLTLWGVVILAGSLYERFRYKPLEAAPLGRDWSRTPERFIDPETGRPVTVYVEAGTGSRKYVAE
jgi:hypothetical protein